jgi:hypothetical protein
MIPNIEIKIISRHDTLAEAVAAANIDLSYNPADAKQSIKLSDSGYNRDRGVTEAYVCEDGKVRYVYQADIALLHEFNPFVSCLHDGPFQICVFVKELMSLTALNASMAKTAQNRKYIRNMQTTNSPEMAILAA